MRLLLDTNVVIPLVQRDRRKLGAKINLLLSSDTSEFLVSVASLVGRKRLADANKKLNDAQKDQQDNKGRGDSKGADQQQNSDKKDGP